MELLLNTLISEGEVFTKYVLLMHSEVELVSDLTFTVCWTYVSSLAQIEIRLLICHRYRL